MKYRAMNDQEKGLAAAVLTLIYPITVVLILLAFGFLQDGISLDIHMRF